MDKATLIYGFVLLDKTKDEKYYLFEQEILNLKNFDDIGIIFNNNQYLFALKIMDNQDSLDLSQFYEFVNDILSDYQKLLDKLFNSDKFSDGFKKMLKEKTIKYTPEIFII